MTREELIIRQGWTMEEKVDHSLYVLDAFIHRNQLKCYMVLDGTMESAVLTHLTWMIERSIGGVSRANQATHEKEYGGYPIYPNTAESKEDMDKYLERGQCATYAEDGASYTEAYPLSIWTSEDIYQYARENNLRKYYNK